MAKLAKFNEIVRDFNDVADFAIIYISEAHAADGWAFKVIVLNDIFCKVIAFIREHMHGICCGMQYSVLERFLRPNSTLWGEEEIASFNLVFLLNSFL